MHLLDALKGLIAWTPLGLPAFLFVITVVVFFHELGHFLVGRWCGVRVDVFSVGFGREILGFTDRRGTRWKLGWIPVGGYVKFAGPVAREPAAVGEDHPRRLPVHGFEDIQRRIGLDRLGHTIPGTGAGVGAGPTPRRHRPDAPGGAPVSSPCDALPKEGAAPVGSFPRPQGARRAWRRNDRRGNRPAATH